MSIFFRQSGAFPLTGVSRINLYSVFAEQYGRLINKYGTTEILPTGIIIDNNNKGLYFNLINAGKIDTVIDFENRAGLFPDVDDRQRFCLFITVGHGAK